ncbi:MAG: hypothetical protein U1E02_07290, partial [Hydrogenophaga sp.]|nr:hypothetical protein [Hydrogenophaga sp.]
MLKKIASPLILAVCLLIPHKPIQATPPVSKLALYATSTLAATYLGYLSCSIPQEFTPTIENLRTLSAIPVKETDITQSANLFSAIPTFSPPKGSVIRGFLGAKEPINPSLITIKNKTYMIQAGAAAAATHDEPIWIASCGWDPCSEEDEMRGINPNINLAKRYLGRHIIHGPALFFAHNDDRRIFNFGQDIDQKNIAFMCHLTAGKKVILHGLCRGATAILGCIQNCEINNTICAIIFESPAVSLKAACRDTSINYSHSPLTGIFTHKLLSFYYPNYSPKKAKAQETISPLHIAKNVPLFIG